MSNSDPRFSAPASPDGRSRAWYDAQGGGENAPRPPDVAVRSLSTLPNAFGEAARSFCLSVIAEVYGHGYDPDWHADLDGLASSDRPGWYAPDRGGDFFVAAEPDGAMVACGGFHPIVHKPRLHSRLVERYGNGEGVVQVARVYVHATARRVGLGTVLHERIVTGARQASVRMLYLHAAAHEPGALTFWRRQGYAAFGEIDYRTTRGGRERAVDFELTI